MSATGHEFSKNAKANVKTSACIFRTTFYKNMPVNRIQLRTHRRVIL